MIFCKIIDVKEGEYLYKKGDSGATFYFVITGNLEILVPSGDEFKYSKGIDESTFFGQKKYFNEPRVDFAKATNSAV